ncbi:hypothetical protein ACFOEY_19720 [Paracandidimonas soli]|uniref:hypothetical protein n=1 Tax=Paracandidimonas soli TaxID=1917182 RepID=UPI0036208F76
MTVSSTVRIAICSPLGNRQLMPFAFSVTVQLSVLNTSPSSVCTTPRLTRDWARSARPARLSALSSAAASRSAISCIAFAMRTSN